ncbi:MAG: SDR family oxidoreductase [Thermoplasmata archaeon]
MDDKKLEGKVGIVTGASAGIGRAVCEVLAEKKVNLGLVARNEEKLMSLSESLENEYPIETIVLPTDVRDPDQVEKAVDKSVEHFGGIDIMVNNAGIIRYGEIQNFSTEDYKAVMETNCDGMFFFTRETIPHLKKSKGNLVFIGSFDANHPRSYNVLYPATKWWINAFAHSIESVVGKSGVGVSLINPSEVRTDIESEEGEKYKDKYDSDEILEPEEVADAVLFAVAQDKTTTASEINLYRRDKMSEFF